MPASLDRFANHWQLNPEVDFLNHGSFGACPTVVLADQRRWQDQLERDPIEFLAPERGLLPRLQRVRQAIADLVGAPPQDLVFVRNATDGVNAVVRSIPLQPGDQIVITDHGYGACNRAIRLAAEAAGATVVCAQVPFPIDRSQQVVDAIAQLLTPRTRLVVTDHVTSPTALIFPIDEIIQLCKQRSIRVLIDGAHAPGMVPIDLARSGADYYTGNHHKWLCGPKASGFLYVHPQWQPEIRPTVISHAPTASGGSSFQAEFDWVGTYDPSPLLAMPAAIDFLQQLLPGGLAALQQRNHQLAIQGRNAVLAACDLAAAAPDQMLGSMATIQLSCEPQATDQAMRAIADRLRDRLVRHHRIEVPVFPLGSQRLCLRISAQAYNDPQQYQRLAAALASDWRP